MVVSHDVNTMPSAASERIRSARQMSGLLMMKQSDPIGPIITSLFADSGRKRGRRVEESSGFSAH
jgi:hypothetical protein